MTRLAVLLAFSGGFTVTAVAWILLKPPVMLARRVRPYTQVASTRLLRGVDIGTYIAATRQPSTIRAAFAPVVSFLAGLVGWLAGPRDDEMLATRLRQSGLYPGTDPGERIAAFKSRTLLTALLLAGGLGFVGWSNSGTIGFGIYATGGLVLGSTLSKGRIDRAVRQRQQLMLSELYTINQILAMRARVGGGVVDALRHVAARSTGIVSAEIRDALIIHRSGIPIADSLRRTAAVSAEPEASRLYQSLAIAHERGTDLAESLLALAADLRNDRRDQAVSQAASRRVAAVIPIVVILAPIAIVFLAAPLPSLIFGT